MMGVGSLYAKTENNPRDGLKEAFEWHLTPGTYEQKEYAMQNPGEWVRIERPKKGHRTKRPIWYPWARDSHFTKVNLLW